MMGFFWYVKVILIDFLLQCVAGILTVLQGIAINTFVHVVAHPFKQTSTFVSVT